MTQDAQKQDARFRTKLRSRTDTLITVLSQLWHQDINVSYSHNACIYHLRYVHRHSAFAYACVLRACEKHRVEPTWFEPSDLRQNRLERVAKTCPATTAPLSHTRPATHPEAMLRIYSHRPAPGVAGWRARGTSLS